MMNSFFALLAMLALLCTFSYLAYAGWRDMKERERK